MEDFPAMDLTTGGHWLVIRQVTITLQSINIDSDDSQCEWDLLFKAPIYGRVYIPLGGRLFFLPIIGESWDMITWLIPVG